MAQFVWAGPSSGNWQTAANWNDVTNALYPATAAPGSLDSVSILSSSSQYQFIAGTGSATGLTVSGNNAVLGTIAAAFVALSSGTLAIEGGATLSTSSIAASGTLFVTGAGARLAATDALTLAGGALSVTGGLLQARSLVLGGIGSILSVDAGGTAEIGVVTGTAARSTAGALTIDAGATLSVTNQNAIFPSAILGVVVDNGLIAATELDIGNLFFLPGASPAGPAALIAGSGTVEALAGGTVEFGAAVTGGALTIQADAGATLGFDDSVAAGTQVRLSGGGAVVRVGPSYARTPTAFGAVISGFDGSDVLLVDGVTITAVAFQAGVGGAAGTLSLLDGSATVDTIAIAGSFTSQSFAGYAVGATTAEIVIAASPSSGTPSSGTPSSGTPGPDQYLWTGPIAGDWNAAANWRDVTAGQASAAVAPGRLDQVTFNSPATVFQVIAGTAAAASVTFNGENLVVGAIATATLVSAGTLEIDAGATISAGQATVAADLTSAGSGAGLLVSGALVVNLGTIRATGGGRVRAGSVTLGGTVLPSAMVVDAASVIEVGPGGGATVGALTVDAGATLAVTNSSSVFPATISGNVVLNGLLTAAELDFGNSYFAPGLDLSQPVSTLAGSGTLEVVAGGTVEIGGPVLAGGLTMRLGAGATLRFDADVAAGTVVDLAASGNVVQIGAAGTGAPARFDGTIVGFDPGDVLVLNGSAVTGTQVTGTQVTGTQVTGTQYAGGTLALLNGATVVASIRLAGLSNAAVFSLVPLGPGAVEIALSDGGPNTAPGGPGTSTSDSFAWVGAIAGAWNSAANWQDLTASRNPADVAPGALDLVTIASPTAAFRLLDGVGAAASIALSGNNAVLGALAGGTVTSTGSLLVAAGGTLAAGGLTASGVAVTGAGATLSAVGTLVLAGGELGATAGGLVQASALTVTGLGAGITVDAASALEVGTAGAAQEGAVVIDAGATLALSNTGSISPNYLLGRLVVDGQLVAAELDIGNRYFFAGAASDGPVTSVAGHGTIEALTGGTIEFGVAVAGSLTVRADGGGTLHFDAGVASGVAVVLGGDGAVLQLGTAGAASAIHFDAVVSGFGGTDVLMIDGALVNSVSYRADAGGGTGTLDLAGGSGVVQSLRLAGNYAGRGFAVNANPAGQSQVSVTTACFAKGTLIATPSGPRAVEDLREGEAVLTRSGTARDVRWIGTRALDCRRHPRPHDILPIRVRKDAFGPARPSRDLWLSPDHAVFHNGCLFPVRTLVNGGSVVQEHVAAITYFHVELASHDVILAEGLEVESYLDTGNRAAFENSGVAPAEHPDFARGADCARDVWAVRSCAALETSGPAVADLRALLLARLPQVGFELVPDPDPDVSADNLPADAQWDGQWMRAVVPDGTRLLRLRSRTAAAAECDPHSDDRRRLGLAVDAVWLDGISLALDDRRLAAGWHDPEPALRWTNGDAILLLDGAKRVEIAMAVGFLRYTVAALPCAGAALPGAGSAFPH